MGGGLFAIDNLAAVMPKLPSAVTTLLTTLLFLGLSLKSRVFNPLSNARPNRAKAIKGESTGGFNDRVMPSWTPPGIFFPIMWVLIVAPLRAFSTVQAATVSGALCNPATMALVLHLSCGDTWNTINNVERRTGAAVPGVLIVWASCLNAVIAHGSVSSVAGKALGVTLAWITVAAALVTDTWRLNGKEALYPVKGAAETKFAWFQKKQEMAAPALPLQLPTESVGAAGTDTFRLFFRRDGARVSPWHNVPLESSSHSGCFNMITEIPKMTKAKMEVATKEAFNPIAQDMKKGVLRDYHGPIFWNYGCLPQTWEDPNIKHPELKCFGDDDPIDVVEIGSTTLTMGSITPVKPLGVLAMIDDGELDWKVLAISVSDPLAAELNDVADVEAKMPGTVSGIREWFRWYKTPDGKPLNSFGFNEECLPAATAKEVIAETHAAWQSLQTGSAKAGKLWVK
jgi:inorganic pyrophosphatase